MVMSVIKLFDRPAAVSLDLTELTKTLEDKVSRAEEKSFNQVTATNHNLLFNKPANHISQFSSGLFLFTAKPANHLSQFRFGLFAFTAKPAQLKPTATNPEHKNNKENVVPITTAMQAK